MKSRRTKRPPAIPVAEPKKKKTLSSLIALGIVAAIVTQGVDYKGIVSDFSPPPKVVKKPEVIVVDSKPTPVPKPTPVAEVVAPKPVVEPEPKKPELTHDQRFANALKEYKDAVDKKVEEVGLSVWCPSVAEFQGLSQPQREVLPFMKYVSGTEEAYELRTSLEKKHNLEQKLYHTIQYQLWGNVKDRCRAITKYSKKGKLLEYNFGELKSSWNASKAPILENWPFINDVTFMWDKALIDAYQPDRRTVYVPYVVMKDSEMASKGQYAVAQFEILIDKGGITFDNMSPGRGQLRRGRGVMTHVDVLGYILESHQ